MAGDNNRSLLTNYTQLICTLILPKLRNYIKKKYITLLHFSQLFTELFFLSASCHDRRFFCSKSSQNPMAWAPWWEDCPPEGWQHRAEVLYSANSVVAPSQTPLEGRDKTFSSIPRRNRREVLINKQHMLILQWWEIQVDNFWYNHTMNISAAYFYCTTN